MGPFRVALIGASCRRRRLPRIPFKPETDVIVVELLAPDHPGESLPLHEPRVVVALVFLKERIILIGLAHAGLGHIVKVCEWARMALGGKAQADPRRSPSRRLQHVMRRRLGPSSLGVHRSMVAVDDVFVNSILEISLRPLG